MGGVFGGITNIHIKYIQRFWAHCSLKFHPQFFKKRIYNNKHAQLAR
jgi:hypothetical protein